MTLEQWCYPPAKRKEGHQQSYTMNCQCRYGQNIQTCSCLLFSYYSHYESVRRTFLCRLCWRHDIKTYFNKRNLTRNFSLSLFKIHFCSNHFLIGVRGNISVFWYIIFFTKMSVVVISITNHKRFIIIISGDVYFMITKWLSSVTGL